jgi:hypothetical protein
MSRLLTPSAPLLKNLGEVLVMSLFRQLAAVFVFAGCLYAQLDRGTITGTVSDPQGAVISAAKVTATNTATNVSSATTTTQTGDFTIPSLLLGN